MRHSKLFLSALAILALACVATAPVLAADHYPLVEAESFTFTKIAEGVFHAVGHDDVTAGCNSAVVESGDGLLLVDSHMTPAAAKALLADLPKVSDLPVRYVVNTHFHFDHVQGNQVFGPGVEILSHHSTREKIASGATREGIAFDSFVGGLPDRIAAAEAHLAEASDEEKEAIQARIDGSKAWLAQDGEVELTPPTMTFEREVLLHRGGREIRILHPGRGHTVGDVIVYLPAEKVLVSGDLITAGLPYMGDAYFADWIDTLDRVLELDIEVISPGHGGPFEDLDHVRHIQEYLRDFWTQAQAIHARDLRAADAVTEFDLGGHAEHFEGLQAPGAHPHAVQRAWALLEAESAD